MAVTNERRTDNAEKDHGGGDRIALFRHLPDTLQHVSVNANAKQPDMASAVRPVQTASAAAW